MWFENRPQRHIRRMVSVLKQLGLCMDAKDDGRVQLVAQFDFEVNVQAEVIDGFVRITGFPNLWFRPKQFPTYLMTKLLVRNAEVAAGGWRLQANEDQVWCCFGLSISIGSFTVRSATKALELILSETYDMAVRVKHGHVA